MKGFSSYLSFFLAGLNLNLDQILILDSSIIDIL